MAASPSIPTFTTLLLSVDDDGIALLTINRPDKLNALNATVFSELDACLRFIAEAAPVKALIVTGAGPKSFVAGADIQELTSLGAETGQALAERGQAVFTALETLPKPVIAAVNGFALGGGCELALACHLRVASETARFGQPEVNLGLLPGYGGTQRLPRLVGLGLATELILTGDMIDAQRAYEIGLVSRVVPADNLMDTARSLAQTIASKAPLAVALALEALRVSHLPLAQGLSHEALLFGQACSTDDFHEGTTAFLEHRKPDFKGR